MALTYSKMLNLGTEMPAFSLPNTINNQVFDSQNLDEDKGVVIMFICNHCPYVVHYHDKIVEITTKYLPKINFVAVSANDIKKYPEDSPEKMTLLAQKLGVSFPYLYDETQQVAKAYQAVCTPEFYLFNKNKKLIYRGRLDDSYPNNGKEVTGKDLTNAIDNYLSDNPISEKQHPSLGCNIKWK
jgi:peroxiredoxin